MDMKKCDRCGKTFDNRLNSGLFDFMKPKTVVGLCTLNKNYDDIESFDLCADCVDEFSQWMDKEGEGNE